MSTEYTTDDDDIDPDYLEAWTHEDDEADVEPSEPDPEPDPEPLATEEVDESDDGGVHFVGTAPNGRLVTG